MNPEQTNRPMPPGRPISAELRSIVACGAWWTWMYVFGRGTDYLDEDPSLDLLRWLVSWGWIGVVAGFAMGFGIATALALLTYRWSGRVWIVDSAPAVRTR